MSDPPEGYTHCDGCGLYYVDTGCGQDREHANCPRPCLMCGKPIIWVADRHPEGACQGHSFEEFRDWNVGGRQR